MSVLAAWCVKWYGRQLWRSLAVCISSVCFTFIRLDLFNLSLVEARGHWSKKEKGAGAKRRASGRLKNSTNFESLTAYGTQ